jgi:alpha-methylacyl-CoA racemase
VGPLEGIKIIEMAGIGPGPFCAMLLADLGAEVIRVDRMDGKGDAVERDPRFQIMNRNRRSIAVDLKNPDAVTTLLDMCGKADALLEGFRPGVMERLGLGPDVCLEANPALVYARMTGWGQDGPLAKRAGHDINYVALSGVLSMLGRSSEKPLPPLNIIGDMAGGGLMMAYGMVSAILHAKLSGTGQVVDTAMTEGSALMAAGIFGLRGAGLWQDERGANLLDGGAPFYDVYETADGGHMAVGAIEPQFYVQLLEGLELDPADRSKQMDRSQWPDMRSRFTELFKGKSRDEWTAIFENKDACVTPVLSLTEAAEHPHNKHRGTYASPEGVLQAAPAPRFSRTPVALESTPPQKGQHTEPVLSSYGFTTDDIARLRGSGAIK